MKKLKCCRVGCAGIGKWKVSGNPLFLVCDECWLELSRSSSQVIVGPSEVKEERHEGQRDS